MPTKRTATEILFGGGWATDYGQMYTAAPSGGKLVVPFLTTAQNVRYELDGAPHKIGGAEKVNSVTITDPIMGMFDFWKAGTAGSPTQKRVCHAGTKVYKEDLDGTWDQLIAGLTAGAMPCYTVYGDLLIISSSATADAPQKWNQAATAALGGTPPNFAFATNHKNRIWASGNPAYPSRLYYTGYDDPEDWTSSDAGAIDISTDDGNVITGLYGEHKDLLWIFKGRGNARTATIHYLSGSSPGGADPFVPRPFKHGIDCVNHQGIIPFADDLAFVSSNGIYSLAATEKYGDFEQATISRPINGWFRRNVSGTYLPKTWGVNYEARGVALWNITRRGQTESDTILACDYRFTPPRWARWTLPKAASIAMVSQDGIPELWGGGYTGYALKLDRSSHDMDGTTYTGKVTLPWLNFGSSLFLKTVASGFVQLVSKGNFPIRVGYKRDRNARQTFTVSQAGGDLLTPTLGSPFVLNQSTLSGSRSITQPAGMEGEFRDLEFDISNGEANQDMEVHALSLLYDIGAISEEAA
jgi:hypothetical protein